ncbi:MAG: hypothetical protein ACQEVA_18415 [Myxococcota bacterium]
MTLRLSSLLASLAAVSVLTLGCDSDVCRHTGQQGEFVFEYHSEKDTHNFNKPIIAGGRLILSVYSVGDEQPIDVIEAHSRAPRVIRVERLVSEEVVLRGVAPGRAEIHVKGVGPDGAIHTDIIAMRVDEAAVIDFDASGAWVTRLAGESDYLRVPTGSEVEIPWTLWSATGEPLVGSGAIPVVMDPADSADVDSEATDGDKVKLFMPSMPTVFELRPADGFRGDNVVIEVYEAGSVEALADPTWAPLWMWLPALLFFPLLWWIRRKTYGRYG